MIQRIFLIVFGKIRYYIQNTCIHWNSIRYTVFIKQRGNISSRFFSNSDASAPELLKNLK